MRFLIEIPGRVTREAARRARYAGVLAQLIATTLA
jgi:hypothetical protein